MLVYTLKKIQSWKMLLWNGGLKVKSDVKYMQICIYIFMTWSPKKMDKINQTGGKVVCD
jgi:hypothetical protein